MTEPTQGLAYQDDLPAPRVALRVVLALLRVLAGRRGHSRVRWWGGGFMYEVRVVRRSHVTYFLDDEPGALGGNEARDRLRAHLVDNEP